MCGNVDIAPPAVEVMPPEQAAAIASIDAMLAGMTFDFMNVRHTFGEGIYTRTGIIAAQSLIIGAKHRAANVFHIARGKILVWDEFHGTRLLEGPFSEMTKPGTQRIGFALTEVEGSNIFQTEKTTAAEVEAEMLFPFVLPADAGKKVFNLLHENLVKQIALPA
jgi:hypothetical protein